MKQLNKKFILSAYIALFFSGFTAFSQPAQKGNLSIALSYFTDNNKLPYISVKVKTKVKGRFTNVSDIPLKLYLNNDSAGNLIKAIVTNEKGEAAAIIPPSLKNQWISSVKHSFLATFDGDKKFEPAKADLSVGKAKILIDTTSDKKIVARVFELKDTSWVPVKGVDVIFAIKRLDAYLNVNETATFTTDSTGQASADFKRDKIPGDANGNIVIVAKVDDNDQYGNLLIEKTVPWGAKFIPVNNFDKRTLFATSAKAPVWLLLIAGSIVISVWGVMVLLVINLFKIKKLGVEV
ncbi:MAG TPA: hypothetical protein VNV85_13450 [Puia sp.]|jgi:hypothetical protein|nr:hypothetical protein [Puia sp.]